MVFAPAAVLKLHVLPGWCSSNSNNNNDGKLNCYSFDLLHILNSFSLHPPLTEGKLDNIFSKKAHSQGAVLLDRVAISTTEVAQHPVHESTPLS